MSVSTLEESSECNIVYLKEGVARTRVGCTRVVLSIGRRLKFSLIDEETERWTAEDIANKHNVFAK
jgi:hypothetical protein